jgi:hypothetical protein
MITTVQRLRTTLPFFLGELACHLTPSILRTVRTFWSTSAAK